jgi:hypothetical protein
MSEMDYEVLPIVINGNGLVPDLFNNTYRYTFPQGSVNFKNSKIALSNLNIFYSWFNISAVNQNNTFSVLFPTFAGSTLLNITIPDGFYDVATLNAFLQQIFITNNFYLVNGSGQNVYYMEFITNASAYAVQMNSFPVPTALPAGWTNPGSMTFPVVASTPLLNVPATNFRNIIGFNTGTYPAIFQATNFSKISDFTPQVTPINSVIIACSLLSNSYAIPNTIFYSFSTQGASFGSVISVQSTDHSYVDIQDGSYNSFTLSFLDQNFNQIKINDTSIIVQLLIKNPKGIKGAGPL